MRISGSRRARRCTSALSLTAVVLLAGGACTGTSDGDGREPTRTPSATPTATPTEWSEPGLVDTAGTPVEVPLPAPVSGETWDVAEFGAEADDGADDGEAIRDALSRARPGDEVLVPAGTYDLIGADPDDERTHLTLPDGVHLRGDGAGRTILRSHFDGEEDSTVIRAQAVTDAAVLDLTVTSTYDGPLGTDTEAEPGDDGVGGGPMFGILVGERDGHGSARVLVEGVRVERFQRHGISVKASREVTVRGNEVADATAVGVGGSGYGIAVEGRADQRDPEAPNDSRHNVVVDNRLDGTHLRHAILLQFATHNNLVADNEIEGSLLDAIDLHGEGEYLNEIRGNSVNGGRRAAIALGNSGGSTHQHGATGEGNWVHGNVLVGNREGIIVILGTPETVVEDNRIVAADGSEAAIRLDDAPDTVLRGNEVESKGVDGFEELVDER
jgi:hypothetical protein